METVWKLCGNCVETVWKLFGAYEWHGPCCDGPCSRLHRGREGNTRRRQRADPTCVDSSCQPPPPKISAARLCPPCPWYLQSAAACGRRPRSLCKNPWLRHLWCSRSGRLPLYLDSPDCALRPMDWALLGQHHDPAAPAGETFRTAAAHYVPWTGRCSSSTTILLPRRGRPSGPQPHAPGGNSSLHPGTDPGPREECGSPGKPSREDC